MISFEKKTKKLLLGFSSLLLLSLLLGAGKKDISKARGIRLTDKIPRFQFVLPRPKKKSRNPLLASMPKWRFCQTETQKDRDLVFWKDLLKKSQEILSKPERFKITEEQKKRLKMNIAVSRKQIREIQNYYKSVRIVVEDPDDPDTCLIVKTEPINREYSLERAVAERKAIPPIWWRYRVLTKAKLISEAPDLRFPRWEGWYLHQVWTQAVHGGTEPKRFHDMVYLWRHIYIRGGPYLVEVSCRWTDTKERSNKFAESFKFLLRGFYLLDRR